MRGRWCLPRSTRMNFGSGELLNSMARKKPAQPSPRIFRSCRWVSKRSRTTTARIRGMGTFGRGRTAQKRDVAARRCALSAPATLRTHATQSYDDPPPPKGHSMTDAQLGHFLVSRLEQSTPRLTRPSVSLLQGMHYIPSHQTDIRVTLDKARAELEKR